MRNAKTIEIFFYGQDHPNKPWVYAITPTDENGRQLSPVYRTKTEEDAMIRVRWVENHFQSPFRVIRRNAGTLPAINTAT